MSPRSHFWLRTLALTLIVLLEIVPRIAAHTALHSGPAASTAEVARR